MTFTCFKQLKGIISALCHDSEWNSFSIYFSSSVPHIIPIPLYFCSGFQHICNHSSCTQSFPSVNTKHSHYVFPLETLTFVIENAPGIFYFSSTTDTSSIYITTTDSWSTVICSTFLHHLERKRKELRNQGKGEGMDILKKTLKLKQWEKHKAETTPKALAKVLSLVCKKNSERKKTLLHQVCAHCPGGDQRHIAQHGTELLSLQLRDLPTGCRKRPQLLMPNQNHPACSQVY